MIKALFYPGEVKFHRDNILASMTNFMCVREGIMWEGGIGQGVICERVTGGGDMGWVIWESPPPNFSKAYITLLFRM